MVDVATAPDGSMVAVGAEVVDGSDPHPAAWRLDRAHEQWQTVTVTPSEPDGTHTRLMSIAFRHGGQAVALGVATGGLHGNPRPVLWVGDAGGLRETYLLRELFGGPRIIEVRGVAAGELGWFAVGTWSARGPERQVAQVWRTTDPPDWERLADEPSRLSAPGEQLWGESVAVGPGRVVVVGRTDRYGSPAPADRADAAAWSSTDGVSFVRSSTLARPGAQGMTSVAYDGGNFVAVGLDGGQLVAWTSADGETWTAPRRLDDRQNVVVQEASAAPGVVVIAGTVSGQPTVWRLTGDHVERTELPWRPAGTDIRTSAATDGARIVAVVTDGRTSRAWEQPLGMSSHS